MKQIYRNTISFQSSGVVHVILLILLAPWEWVLCWIMAVAAHELGHYMGFHVLRIPVNRMRCTEKGVFIETRPITPREELFVASLGPLASCVLVLAYKWIPMVSVCAGAQLVYNLLPVGENDGQRMVKSLLLLFGCNKRIDIFMKIVSWISVCVLVAIGLWFSVWLKLGVMPMIVVFVILMRTFPCKQRQQIVQ